MTLFVKGAQGTLHFFKVFFCQSSAYFSNTSSFSLYHSSSGSEQSEKYKQEEFQSSQVNIDLPINHFIKKLQYCDDYDTRLRIGQELLDLPVFEASKLVQQHEEKYKSNVVQILSIYGLQDQLNDTPYTSQKLFEQTEDELKLFLKSQQWLDIVDFIVEKFSVNENFQGSELLQAYQGNQVQNIDESQLSYREYYQNIQNSLESLFTTQQWTLDNRPDIDKLQQLFDKFVEWETNIIGSLFYDRLQLLNRDPDEVGMVLEFLADSFGAGNLEYLLRSNPDVLGVQVEEQLFNLEVKYDQLGIQGSEYVDLILDHPEILTQNLSKMGSLVACFHGRGVLREQLAQIVRRYPLIFISCNVGNTINKLDELRQLCDGNWISILTYRPQLILMENIGCLRPELKELAKLK
eukprot:TRINITY_DN4824_c0_g1_i5.p1 TRINITY_DN4824_c0_g1~~TRINITY_DN4824_c0_g1_i5.p1  ORF type:complete len:406 (-),score=36.25 TRINITY_DN4824_c0_g1_i5:95-1312(-)